MPYNHKKSAQTYEHYDKFLKNKREKMNHKSVDVADGNYESVLNQTRKNEEKKDIHEKQLQVHHTDASPKTTEQWFDAEGKHDDRTWKTSTTPINELAEEAQRARIKARGDGDGMDDSHFQDYKKVDVGLSHENFADLSNTINQIDRLWMASSWNRMTTSEKKEIKKLIAHRNFALKNQWYR